MRGEFAPRGFTSCDPLPTGQLEPEKRAEIDRDWSPENREKRASTVRSPLGRIRVGLLFSTKVLWGVGRWLKDAGRGLQKRLPKLPLIAKIEEHESETFY